MHNYKLNLEININHLQYSKYNFKNTYNFSFVLVLKLKHIANAHIYGFNCSYKFFNMISKLHLMHYWDSLNWNENVVYYSNLFISSI
jgi:hypothetical protein